MNAPGPLRFAGHVSVSILRNNRSAHPCDTRQYLRRPAFFSRWATFALFALPAIGIPAHVQDLSLFEGQKVSSIEMASRPDTNVDALRSLIAQKPGEPFSNALIQQSITALKNTGEFTTVKLQVTPETGGLRLLFILEPAYYLGLVQFPGATDKFAYARLLQVLQFQEGEPFLRSRMTAASNALRQFFSRWIFHRDR